MNNSICGEDVRGDHVSIPGDGLYVETISWIISLGDNDLLTPCCLQGGCFRGIPKRDPKGHVFGHNSGTRNNVAEKHSCKGVLVIEEVVEGVLRDLGKSIIGGGEDGEGTLSSEGVDQAGSFDGSKKGGELRGGDGELCNVLGRSWGRPGSAVVAMSWRAGHQAQAGQADEGLHVEAEVVVSKIEAE